MDLGTLQYDQRRWKSVDALCNVLDNYIKYRECNTEFLDRKRFSTRSKTEELGILLEIRLRWDVFSDLAAMTLRCAGLFLVCSKATLTKQKRCRNFFLFKTPFPCQTSTKKSYHEG